MTNEENINNIVSEVVIFGNEVSVDALKYALSLLARRKDQQFKEYLEENLSDIIFECIEEYKKLKGSLNDDGTLRSDYQLAQDITITYQYKIINEFFKEDKK